MKEPQYNKNPKVVIKETTKTQLDQLKLVKSETYDSVIVRLIENDIRFSEGIKIEDKVKHE